jgi:RNA exonuclease 4
VLARCSIVNSEGQVLYDKYVRSMEPVTDYRTHVSGIEPHHISADNPHAIDLQVCRAEVTQLLAGRVLIGHSLKNDLDALMLSHPPELIRDTATYKAFCPHRPRSLRVLVQEHLHLEIHQNSHDSVSAGSCCLLPCVSLSDD